MDDTLIEQLESALTDAVNNEMSMKQACSHYDLMAIIAGLKKKTEMHYAVREALECQIGKLKQKAGAKPGAANLGCATTWQLLDEIRARLQAIDMPDYRTVDKFKEDKPKKKAEPVAIGHVIRRLRELARDLDSRDMSLLGVFTNLKILIANLKDSGMCGPKVESSRIVIERAEAKPPKPTVSENAMSVAGMINAVISEMDRENPNEAEYIGMLRAIQCSEALHDLEKYRPPAEKPPPAAVKSDAMFHLEELEEIIKQVVECGVGIKLVYPVITSHLNSLKENIAEGLKIETRVKKIFVAANEASPLAQKLLNIFDKMSMKPAGDLLQSIEVLYLQCQGLGYGLSIKRDYNTTKWHVMAIEDDTVIETASSPHLPDAVWGLRNFLVRDSKDTPRTISQVAADVFEKTAVALKTKTLAQIVADLEANALDVIAEVKKVKKRKEQEETALAANMILVEKRKAVEKAMEKYNKAIEEYRLARETVKKADQRS